MAHVFPAKIHNSPQITQIHTVFYNMEVSVLICVILWAYCQNDIKHIKFNEA